MGDALQHLAMPVACTVVAGAEPRSRTPVSRFAQQPLLRGCCIGAGKRGLNRCDSAGIL